MRLVAREDVNGFATGAVQVFVGGRWGSVCTDRFDDRDADVACRQLGFVAGVESVPSSDFRQLLRSGGAETAEIIAVRAPPPQCAWSVCLCVAP